MRILHRYLLTSTALAALGGVALFVFVLITGNAMRDIIGLLADGQISIDLFVKLLLMLVPYAVSFAMPLGMLVGILLVMGRLSSSQELTALRASGQSLLQITSPVLLIALCGTFLCAWINAFYAPTARAQYKAIVSDIVRNDPLSFIIPLTFIHDFPGYVIYVGQRDGTQLRDLWLWELDERNRAVRLLRARSGEFSYDAEGDALVITLISGFTELRDQRDPDNLRAIQPTLSFSNATIRLPLENVLAAGRRSRDLNALNFIELHERRTELIAERSLAEDPAIKDALYAQQIRAQYFMSRSLAMAASIFALTLIGIPLGIQASRSETYANAGLALILALGYYTLLVFIDWTQRTPQLRPDLLIWLPNYVCVLCGGILMWRQR